MRLQVDVWSGDLHQNHVHQEKFDDWEKASVFIQDHVERGHLCNVLLCAFAVPSERKNEEDTLMGRYLNRH